MFNIGDNVMYGRLGVYRIEDIKDENFSGETRSYYVLVPENQKDGTAYIPVDMGEKKLKRVPDEKEAKKVISDALTEDMEWITDNKARHERASEIIKSGDRVALLRLVRLYRTKKAEAESNRRKFFAADEKSLAEAEALIFRELSVALGVSPDDVRDMVLKDK